MTGGTIQQALTGSAGLALTKRYLVDLGGAQLIGAFNYEFRAFQTQSFVNQGLSVNSTYGVWDKTLGWDPNTAASYAHDEAVDYCERGGANETSSRDSICCNLARFIGLCSKDTCATGFTETRSGSCADDLL
jgi:hypothetical protein